MSNLLCYLLGHDVYEPTHNVDACRRCGDFDGYGEEPFFTDFHNHGLLPKITVPVRHWWADTSFWRRHGREEHLAHAHWVRRTWGLEDDEYCPF